MAKGPNQLSILAQVDKDAVAAIERFIDDSDEFREYNGTDVTVVVPRELWDQHMSKRSSIRWQELVDRYQEAGWAEVGGGPVFKETGQKITFYRYKRRYSSEKD